MSKFIITGPCHRGHTGKRYASNGMCVDCTKIDAVLRQPLINAERKTMPWKALVREAKKRARKNGREYNLNIKWAEANWSGVCALTGIPFDPTKNAYRPSLDRIDNSKGYTQDNCRFILSWANTVKGTRADADVINLAYKIVEAHKAGKIKT